jgi:light-regulated signal transduction histidine kinase (bacteriophytochrome)
MPLSNELQTSQPDLTSCDREPIHLPGSIQPHGALLVVDEAGLVVLYASDNCAKQLGAAAADVIGSSLDSVIGPAADILRSNFGSARTDDNPALLLTMSAPADGARLQVLAHRRHGRILLELEPAGPGDVASGESAHANVLAAALRLGTETTVRKLCDTAASEVRRLTGFDRVMIYQFDADGHGEVVAEDRDDGWNSYLGHHFPASDVPQQARALYLLNRVRLIPDANYCPANILPRNDPTTGQPIDLSYATLRSVSPIHVEYLKNMGVIASMSVSLVVEGRLWGLIACHHRTPKFVPHELRSGCDHLGRVFTAQLAANQRAEERDSRLSLTLVLTRLLERMAGHADFADGLIESAQDLLELTAAKGVAVAVGGRFHLFGHTPEQRDVERLVGWLAAASGTGVFATDWLAREYQSAEAFSGVAGGVLAVAFDPSRRDYIVWFRPEVIHSVTWGGDPNKPVGPTDRQTRIHPRRSFEAWTQVVRHRSLPWEQRHIDAAAAFRAAITGIVFRKANELAQERQRRGEAEAANRAKDRHLAFLAHELRGPLTPALLTSAAMVANADLPPDVRSDAAVIRRNIELATRLADDLLDANRIALGKLEIRVETVDVHESVRAAVAMCEADAAAKGAGLVLDLRAVRHVVDADAPKLTQVWTNLLKNAVKFSPDGGTVTIRTSDAADGRLRVEVQDRGMGVDVDLLPRMFNLYEQGDRSVTRNHSGLGLGLTICKGIVDAHGGAIAAFSAGRGTGTTMTVELPAAIAGKPDLPVDRVLPTARQKPSASMRILLVDDDKDTLRVMARLLGRLTHRVTTASGVGPALSAAERGEFDILISDIGLGDGSGLDLMRELAKLRPIRGIALTGYGTESDMQETKAAGFEAHLTKPIDFQRLEALILSG